MTPGRVVLVETSPVLPGLFPLQSWEVLRDAGQVWARDPDTHPSAPFLAMAGIPLARLEPSGDLRGIDLLSGGPPAERRRSRALVERARDGAAAYLLGPDDPEGFTRAVGVEASREGIDLEFVFHTAPAGSDLLRLVEVERRLRSPDGGCPWDLEQTHESLGRYLVEETYELLDAIESGDDDAIREELGDVLLQVVFHAQIAADRGAFTVDDVARGIADKLVRRHPHVFGDVVVSGSEEVKANWEVLKQQEKARTGPFEGVPAGLPALQLADKLQRRAARYGFDWPAAAGAADKVREELAEVEAAEHPDRRSEEVGDVLNAAVALARHHGADPEQALRAAANRFRRRFAAALAVAVERGTDPASLSEQGWAQLWEQARGRPGGSVEGRARPPGPTP